MPVRPRLSCNFPGCPALVNAGERYCPEHMKRKRKEYKRGRPDDSFYSSTYWRRLRRMQLATEPLCRLCRAEGKRVAAEVVDHIIPREDGGADSFSNLQSLCVACHNSKTMKENIAKGKL